MSSASLPSTGVPAPTGPTPGSRLAPTEWLILAGILVLSVGLYWILRFPNAPLNADSYVYLSGARSFSLGTGYHMAWHVNLPPIGIYPPGNSMWISWFWPKEMGFDEAYPRISFGMCLIGGAVNAAFAAFLLRGGLPRWMALSFTALWSVSPLWVQGLHFFMSDPAFLLFNLIGMSLFLKDEQGASTLKWLGLGVLLGVALVWRSAGMGLVAGVGFILLMGRHSLRNWVAALTLPVLLLLTKSQWAGSGGAGYKETFSAFVVESGGYPGLAWEKFDELLSWFSGRFFFEGILPVISRFSTFLHAKSRLAFYAASVGMFLFFVPLVAVARLGWRRLGKGGKAIGWVLLIYSIQVFLAPNEGWYVHRYLYNVWMLGLLCFGLGLHEIFPEGLKGWGRGRVAFLAVVGVFVALNAIGAQRTQRTWDMPHWRRDLHEAADRVREIGGAKARVAVNINSIPATYLGDALGDRLVENYLETRRAKRAPIFVRHQDQGNVPAEFMVVPDDGQPLESAPVLEPVPLSGSNHVRLFRIVPEKLEEWSRSRGRPGNSATR